MSEKQREDLRERTKQLALRIVKLFAALPTSAEAQELGKRLLHTGISVGVHYREACRGRSNAKYISMMDVALGALDETGYCLELLGDAGLVPAERLANLRQEIDQLTAIFVACVKTATEHLNKETT
jgi:four helix bundle protein